jgi:PAS domain S-box-containing protein
MQALLEYLPDFVLCFDRSLRCTYVNPSVERASGLQRTSFLGKDHVELGAPAQVARVWEGALRRAFAGAAPETLEAPVYFLGVGWQCQAVLLPQPVVAQMPVDSVLVVAHDITERTQAARDRAEFMAQLNEHERRLRDFIERTLRSNHTLAPSGSSHERHDLLRAGLTLHDRDLLRLVSEGHNNAAIGQALGLSGGTVRNQLTKLYIKLGVRDRAHAAARAVALRLVSVEQ